MSNPQKKEGNNNDNYGDFIVITNDNKFDVLIWIPQFVSPIKNANKSSHFPHKGPRGGYRGNFRGGHH